MPTPSSKAEVMLQALPLVPVYQKNNEKSKKTGLLTMSKFGFLSRSMRSSRPSVLALNNREFSDSRLSIVVLVYLSREITETDVLMHQHT